MMDFNERVIPCVSSNFAYMEAFARYKFAGKLVKSKDRIVDLGCGTGYGSSYLAIKGGEVLGVDADSEAIKYAKKHYGKYVAFVKRDITNLKDDNNFFDFVSCFEVIEHLKNPEDFLKKVKRVLKKGGIFVLSTPNAQVVSPHGGVSSPYHIREFNYQELSFLLKKEFRSVVILGQKKSVKAKRAWDDFLKSQEAREGFVEKDRFGIRKILPKSIKEKIWKYLGSFYGRKAQEGLETRDFPINNKEVKKSYYFIAVCRN